MNIIKYLIQDVNLIHVSTTNSTLDIIVPLWMLRVMQIICIVYIIQRWVL